MNEQANAEDMQGSRGESCMTSEPRTIVTGQDT
jgi:hypothetical protein